VVRLVARYAVLALALLVLNFLLPRLLPGDPLDAAAPDGLGAAAPAPVELRAQLRAAYHLDEPLAGQFAAYVSGLARGDLGWSISRAAPVSGLVFERLPWTLALVLTATVLASLIGGLLGVVAAWRGGRAGQAIVSVATGLAALPELLVAIGLLLPLAVGLRWFPLQGGRSPFAPPPMGPFGALGPIADIAWHLTLPIMSLVLATSAAFVLLARGAVRGVLAEPYLLTARAKGLPEARIAVGHAAPNALLPVLALFGVRLGQVLGGALVVERVFAVPGLGLLTFEAIRSRDYPLLQAVFLLSSAGVLLANLVVDVVYLWLTPRPVAGDGAPPHAL